jgi:hypothetical protein
MKKNYTFLIVPSLFILLYFNKNKTKNYSLTLPVCISYIKNTPPPDSIQTFISLYLKSKKIKVIDWSEAMRLFQESTKTEMMSLINSGNLNNRTAKDFASKINPVSNILAVQIFQNTSIDSFNYNIDSIRWQTSLVPTKDTFSIKTLVFVPDNKSETNPYLTLKAFLENVLTSKHLR